MGWFRSAFSLRIYPVTPNMCAGPKKKPNMCAFYIILLMDFWHQLTNKTRFQFDMWNGRDRKRKAIGMVLITYRKTSTYIFPHGHDKSSAYPWPLPKFAFCWLNFVPRRHLREFRSLHITIISICLLSNILTIAKFLSSYRSFHVTVELYPFVRFFVFLTILTIT